MFRAIFFFVLILFCFVLMVKGLTDGHVFWVFSHGAKATRENKAVMEGS